MSHLWSAGMTCHGAHSVEVAVSADSNAAMYSSQRARSSTSPALNFHSAGRVKPGEEALLLLLLGHMEEELDDLRPVAVEVALECVDVLVALLPHGRPGRPVREPLALEPFGVDLESNDLLVVRAVENADAPSFGEGRDAPEEVVVKLLRRG